MHHLKNEEECLEAIEKWSGFSQQGQISNLKKAIETIELNQMYYEDKGSEKGAKTCSKCLIILNKRLGELKREDP